MLILSAGQHALVGTTVFSALGRGSGTLGIVLKAGIVVAAVLINTGVYCRVPGDDSPRCDIPAAGARRADGSDPVAAAAVVRFALRGPRRQIGQCNQQRVRAGSRPAGILYLTAKSLLVSAEINVVRTDHLYPRALLTPFTDDVELTPGDPKAYAGQAKAQRAKGFEHVDVTFNKNDDE